METVVHQKFLRLYIVSPTRLEGMETVIVFVPKGHKIPSPTRLEGMETSDERGERRGAVLSPTRLEGMETTIRGKRERSEEQVSDPP